jgi:dynein intermediate chain
MFNPFDPNMVVAATYSGNVLQWDIRAKTIPINKSCLAKQGHDHPIYSMAIIGS